MGLYGLQTGSQSFWGRDLKFGVVLPATGERLTSRSKDTRQRKLPGDKMWIKIEPTDAASPRKTSCKVKALERKLQLRRPREQLINQGIMPAAMTAPGLLLQKSKLERAQTGDLLQKKIRVRPNRAQLVQRHILDDTSVVVDPSLIAKQIQLKRKKLEDDLNDKLLARPGPLELVKENILEAGTMVGQAVKEGEVDFEDTANSVLLQPISPDSTDGSPIPSPETMVQIPASVPISSYDPNRHNPVLDAVSQLHQLSEGTGFSLGLEGPVKKEGRRKKPPKPKFKKYKYHEYRPPNGEVEKSSLPMDSPYALMLQQQQLYLQLQVLYQNYPYQFVGLPSIPENAAKSSNTNNNNMPEKLIKIEDMRVVDMRKELKMRGIPVSGSKTDLIERLRALNEGFVLSSDLQQASSPQSPTITVSANSVKSAPVTVTVSSPGFVNIAHATLSRSNSLPLEQAHFQQLQMQLMANNQKLQQYPNLPAELQQQIQQLQYLNLQMQLQRVKVQPPARIPPKVQQDQASLPPQSYILSTQQLPSPTTSIKQEPQSPDTCQFAQSQIQSDAAQYSDVSSTSPVTHAPQVSMAIPKVNSMPQFSCINKQNHAELSRSFDDANFDYGSNTSSSGLLLLQAEANRLNQSPSHSESDLSQIDSSDFTLAWVQSQGTANNQVMHYESTSPTNVFTVASQPDQQTRTTDAVNFVQSSPKQEHTMQRSYSNSESNQINDGGILIQGMTAEKQRSNSEPPHPYGHKRSYSLPSTQFFVQPPPTYEAHMAAQIQRKLSHDYTYPLQQQQSIVKIEDMDAMESNQDREISQELQRAMLKQEVGLDHEEILEILGASMVTPQEPKVQNRVSPQITIGSSVPARASPHNLMPNQRLQHNAPTLPKSPSTGFLGVHASPTQQFQNRLSRSCEDVTGINTNVNNKNSMQSCADGSFPDFDSMIISPGSPMKIETDTDYQGIMMPSTSTIPIPGTKNDSLSWLDLSNSPIITSTSPGASPNVTYMVRGSPPAMLYGNSPNPSSGHFPVSMFDLDGAGHLPHDFPEAMDFCV